MMLRNNEGSGSLSELEALDRRFAELVSTLANAAHSRMMHNGARGDYDPIYICGTKITCGDDINSTRARLFCEMRRVPYAEINKALEELSGVAP